MPNVTVEGKSVTNGWEFDVSVQDNGEETKHKVYLSRDYYMTFGTSKSPVELVQKTFEFLLEHEPKESILTEFDLVQVGKYFPEFEQRLKYVLK